MGENGFDERMSLKFDMGEHSFLKFEVVKMSLREFIEGNRLKFFLEENVRQKEMKIEEESIFLEVNHCNLFEENMLLLNLKEFFNTRHLTTFIEEKVDGEKEFIFVQACKDCSLRRLSRASYVKLSASWEAHHVILHFIAFYFLLYFSLYFYF